MRQKDGQISTSSITRKPYQGSPLTYSDVLELLGIKESPGSQWHRDLAVETINETAREKGLDYIRSIRGRILKDLEYIAETF
jgi:hypothetical protein